MYGEMFHRDVRQQVQLLLESFQTILCEGGYVLYLNQTFFSLKKRGSLFQKNCLWAVTNINTNFQDDLLRIIDKAGRAEGFLNTVHCYYKYRIF